MSSDGSWTARGERFAGRDHGWVAILIVLTAVVMVARIATLPHGLENVDGLHFAQGVERYTVAERRPFWPGYPVYILLGKLFTLGSGDAVRALHLLSAVASSASLVPLALLAGEWRRLAGGNAGQCRLAGLFAALLWVVSPVSWLVGTEVFSDPVALCLALSMLWCCWRAIAPEVPGGSSNSPTPPSDRRGWLVGGAVLGALTLGARLAYATLLWPLAWASWRQRRADTVWLPLIAFLVGVGVWLGWQWAHDGTRWFEMAALQLSGHQQAWGGGAGLDPTPLTRPARLAGALAVHGFGMGVQGPARILTTAGLLAVLATGTRRLMAPAAREAAAVVVLWLLPYALGILVTHDVSYPRYLLPLVSLLCVMGGLGLPRRPAMATMTTAAVTACLALGTRPLVLEHRTAPRMGHRVLRWVEDRLDPNGTAILLTPEAELAPFFDLSFFLGQSTSARLLDRVPANRIAGRARQLESEGRVVYATAPAPESPEDWAPVARFCRNPLLETRGPDEVWLFRHQPGAVAGPLPECY